ncbi:hypothetical protein BDN71DRAFT_1428366 [Pleurotus eryngii]|uniref:Uncharacterized protein n=1 Tax=Pleurotus eryngii TaxID=5323 RepID=A0A9P6A2R1_PLEER|nr:hypothetical protein BDN71DRAFT_1428366 [Pleurotus eryngii]
MSTIIAYNVSSLQAVTETFTKLQQQLLAHVAASTGLTWFMDNQKVMYVFAKRASNRKFKQEIDTKWLITWTLSMLKEKTDKLTACTVAEVAQELWKWQQSEVDEEEMKVVKKEEFDALIRPRIETLDKAMRRWMEKGKGKAMDMAASGLGKALEVITVRKIVAPKKCAAAKSKEMVSSETDEMGEAGPPVASPSKAKPRKGSLALPKVEMVERKMCEMTCLPLLGLTDEGGGCTGAS